MNQTTAPARPRGLKMKPEHFDHIKTQIDALLAAAPELVARYERGEFSRSDRVRDLQMRFNFDMLTLAVRSQWLCDELYTYLNDAHIATALHYICPRVTPQFKLSGEIDQ